MQADFPIEEMNFLHLNDARIIDFTKDKDITTILAYNKEVNELLRINADSLFENMLQDGTRIVITKNVKDGKFIINHAYDATLLANINTSLANVIKGAPSSCASTCTNQCMDFCSYNCSTYCTGANSRSV